MEKREVSNASNFTHYRCYRGKSAESQPGRTESAWNLAQSDPALLLVRDRKHIGDAFCRVICSCQVQFSLGVRETAMLAWVTISSIAPRLQQPSKTDLLVFAARYARASPRIPAPTMGDLCAILRQIRFHCSICDTGRMEHASTANFAPQRYASSLGTVRRSQNSSKWSTKAVACKT